MVGDLAVLNPHDINRFEMNPTVRWIDAEERAVVGAIVGFVGRHTIAFRELPMNLRMKVRERRAHVGVELADTSLIRGRSGLSGVIHEIVRKEFFEDFKSPFALNFLGVATHNRFRYVRY